MSENRDAPDGGLAFIVCVHYIVNFLYNQEGIAQIMTNVTEKFSIKAKRVTLTV